MPTSNRCPTCHVELPADAPAGLCPACLLKAGMTSDHIEAGTRTATQSFTPPTPAELAAHFPQLEILELIGQGGMGAVYKAKQVRLDRIVALKVLPKDADKGQEFADRFTREAKAMARLSHPNIIAIHDYGEAAGWFFFIMEYVDGVNLRQAMKATTLQPPDALAMVGQICDALQYAHEENVVHRDIKPENILLTKKGRVKIADFGLAKLLGTSSIDRHLTATQQVMGTIGYMAPEQMEGSKTIDHRADIYALGVVFYELLTGELPIGRFAPPSQKVQIDVRFDEVVLKTLEKEPSRRYQSASQVKHEVERISAGPGSAMPVSLSTVASSSTSTRLTLLGSALLMIGIVELAAGLASFFSYMNVQVRRDFIRDASSPTVQLGYTLIWADFLVLSWIVIASGILILLRRAWGLAVIGPLAAMLPLATVGAMVVPNRSELLRDFSFLQMLGILGIPMGIWGFVELIRPDAKAEFSCPVGPVFWRTYRVLFPRYVNSTLITVASCIGLLVVMIGSNWAYTANNPDPREWFKDRPSSLLAVYITLTMTVFLTVTWPLTWQLVFWRPAITLLGGFAVLASCLYFCEGLYSGSRVIFRDGVIAGFMTGVVLCLNGVWGVSRWMSSSRIAGTPKHLPSDAVEPPKSHETSVSAPSKKLEYWGIALCVLSCILFWPFYNEPLRALGFEPRFVAMSRDYWIIMLLPSVVTGLTLIIAGPMLRQSASLGLAMLFGGVAQLAVTLWIVRDAPTYLNTWLMLILGAALGLLGAWRLRGQLFPGAPLGAVARPPLPTSSPEMLRRRWVNWGFASFGIVAAIGLIGWLALSMGWIELPNRLQVQNGEFVAAIIDNGQVNFPNPYERPPNIEIRHGTLANIRVIRATASGFEWQRNDDGLLPTTVTWTARGQWETAATRATRQLLLGTWKEIDGSDQVTFQADGTFTEKSDSGVSSGIYRWLDGQRLFVHDPNKQPREIRIQVDNETLTIRPESGPIVRFERQYPK